MVEDNKAGDTMSHMDMLQQDLKTVDMMSRWRKKISKGENLAIKVVDKGMMPTIKIGDTVEVCPVNAMDLRTNNVIFYRQGDVFIVRRIIQVDFNKGGQFTVKGDSMDNEEPMVAASQVIGKVVALDREGEKIYIDKKYAALGKLKALSGQSVGGSIDTSFLKNILGKVLEGIEFLYQKICQITDRLLENTRKK